MSRSDAPTFGLRPSAGKSGLLLLFDLGGVLLDAFPRRAVECFAKLSGREVAKLEAPILEVAKLAFDGGRVDPAGFARLVCDACGRRLTLEQVHDCWCAIFEDLPEMQQFTERLAKAHACYLLSNTDPWHYQVAMKRLPWLGTFRGHCLSYEARRLKPDPEYYRAMFKRFQLEPGDCVLVDDRAENVDAIVALGAQGIVHRNVAATAASLAQLGVRA
jgi:HAD superfamily hydrolase (TIGR01509 family)